MSNEFFAKDKMCQEQNTAESGLTCMPCIVDKSRKHQREAAQGIIGQDKRKKCIHRGRGMDSVRIAMKFGIVVGQRDSGYELVQLDPGR